jgi:hypothetical protein
MFFRKKAQIKQMTYDQAKEKPVIRCSICTGEQAGGLMDLKSGKFTEIMLIRGQEDLENFKAMFGLTEVEKIY